MKIVVFSTRFYEPDLFNAHNSGNKLEFIFSESRLDAKTAKLATGADAISISMHDFIDSTLMQTLAKIGIGAIALRCAGYDNVDLDAAAKWNIKVMRVPAYSPQAVAEHAVALIMALNRKTHKAYNRTRSNDFSLNHLMGFDLYAKTVGIVGAGKIGSAFARIMLGFGCKVIAFDIAESEDLKARGVSYRSFETLVSTSDIISIHCPLTDATYHLFNKKSYQMMKPGTMLINTARGSVISTLDTLAALKEKQLGYLGMDVYEWETGIFHTDYSADIVKDDLMTGSILLAFRDGRYPARYVVTIEKDNPMR